MNIKPKHEESISNSFIYDLRQIIYKHVHWSLYNGKTNPIDFLEECKPNQKLAVFIVFDYLSPSKNHEIFEKIKSFKNNVKGIRGGELLKLTALALENPLSELSPLLDSQVLTLAQKIYLLTNYKHLLPDAINALINFVVIWYEIELRIAEVAIKWENQEYNASQIMALYYWYFNDKPDYRKYIDQYINEDVYRIPLKVKPIIDKNDIRQIYEIYLLEESTKKFNNKSVKELAKLLFETDINFNYIPRKVINNQIDTYRKQKKNELTKSLDTPLNDETKSTWIDNIKTFENSIRLSESQKIRELLNWIESIPDPQDRKIAKLYFVEGYTQEEIEDLLPVKQTTISYKIRKLKNKIPSF